MIVTAFSAKGFEEYGRRLARGVTLFAGQQIVAYSENFFGDLENVSIRNLTMVPAYSAFVKRHAGKALIAGREQRPGWKEKDRTDGYCYKFDAFKFCCKVFAIADAARTLQYGGLTWLDADSYPIAEVPRGFFDSLIGPNFDVAYLGRDKTHSECGFLHFRLPAAMPLIQSWENFYASDRFLQETEWHDSFLFDIARKEVPSVRCKSISRAGDRGHVWVKSPLGQVLDHTKGLRKQLGYSPERRGGK